MADLGSLELADSIYWEPPVKFCLACVARVTVSLGIDALSEDVQGSLHERL